MDADDDVAVNADTLDARLPIASGALCLVADFSFLASALFFSHFRSYLTKVHTCTRDGVCIFLATTLQANCVNF